MKKVIILSLLLVFIITGCNLTKSKTAQKVLGPEEAKVKAEKFINENLMQPGKTATIKEIIEDGDLYKIVVDIGGNQDINSYLTKDGKKFFPQAMDVEEIEQQKKNKQATEAKTVSDIPKNDKPQVELFVMSYCPYGTQIEKGILSVLEVLGDKIDFSLKFCDYAMHGKKELDEQLRQYCIQKEQSNKLISYLRCFLEQGKSDDCLDKAEINAVQLNSCVLSVDKQFKITEKYNDRSTWSGGRFPVFDINKEDNAKYGVKGSPALVINGKKVSSGRDSASLLNVICSAFNNPPEECSQKLSSETPAPGFGFGSSGSSSSGGCGG